MARFLKKLLKRARFELLEGRLGLGWPVEVEVWDRQFLAGDWRGLAGPQESAHYGIIASYLPFLKSNPSVLDAGCGQGLLSEHILLRPCSKYLGIDISQEAVLQARRSFGPTAEFEVGDLETFSSCLKFDVIILNESLYYTKNPLEIFKQMQSMLSLQGAIIVSMCEYGHNRSIWSCLEKWFQPSWSTRVQNEKGQAWNIKVFRFDDPAG